MSTWTSGYVADIGYTHGFYRELTPQLISFVALAKGQRGLRRDGRISYCELGCGQGFSTNLLAAANPDIDFHATDFNPSQIAGARALATEAGAANVRFYESSFAEFGSEPELPDAFDVVALHGIYSWISAENRRHIVEFLRRRLKPGGFVYLSYNTLPGWAPVLPLRRLLVDEAGQRTGAIAPRIEEALRAVERFAAVSPGYLAQNPSVPARFEKLKGMSRNYLAHEYFNKDWTPFHFADVAVELAEAKLTFVGSAALLDHVDALNLSGEQAAFLAQVEDPVRREGLRDLIVNQQFRRDVFVKGPLAHSVLSSREAWLETRFAMSSERDDVPLKVTGARGEANLQPDTYGPLLDAFAQGPLNLREALGDPVLARLGWAKLMQALAVLVGAGHLHPALPTKDERERSRRTKAFNAAVCERAKASGDLAFLASPVTGGGVAVDRFAQLFLLAASKGEGDPSGWAWSVLRDQGQRIVRDGSPIESADENLAELRRRYEEFQSRRLPILRRLGIS